MTLSKYVLKLLMKKVLQNLDDRPNLGNVSWTALVGQAFEHPWVYSDL